MFFFLPIRTEKDTARLPYLTIFLIAINFLIWGFTQKIVTDELNEINAVNQQLIAIEHPYLLQSFKENPDFWEDISVEEVHGIVLKEGLIPRNQQAFDEWKNLYAQFEDLKSHMFYRRLGFIPASPNVFKMLSSMFIHGGFLHVFFNMLFLWLVGCNIEDDWKWPKFLVFYLLSGIVACFIYASFSAGSTVPLIGASGAVAGVMGAFLVQHYNTKIRFWYFVWLLIKPRIGTVTVAAYLVLPFWFIQEFFYAQKGIETGTAHWAHVGGFVFGGIFALVMKYFDARNEEDSPTPEPVQEIQPETTASAGLITEETPFLAAPSRMNTAVDLDAFLKEEPENVEARLEIARLIYRRGFQGDALIHYNRALDTLFEKNDDSGVLAVFKEVKGLSLQPNFSESNLYRIALVLEKRGYYKAAVSIFSTLIKRFPKSPMRARAIYRAAQILENQLRNESLAHSAMILLRRDYPEFSVQAG